jgi:hypothetical protein
MAIELVTCPCGAMTRPDRLVIADYNGWDIWYGHHGFYAVSWETGERRDIGTGTMFDKFLGDFSRYPGE